jgi:hypothetical protein
VVGITWGYVVSCRTGAPRPAIYSEAAMRSGPPYPRWVNVYILVLAVCLAMWVILCVRHGGTPWSHAPGASLCLGGRVSSLLGTCHPWSF